MEQRQLRLGDTLDDYCPRERRLTNHAIVAMVGVDVKQTRCTTCETEHEYKHAKVPRQRRKSESPAALFAQVVATAPKRAGLPVDPAAQATDDDGREAMDDMPGSGPVATSQLESPPAAERPDDLAAVDNELADADHDEVDDRADEEGPVHRQLIRASLPREGQPPARPIPEFTIRQPGGGRPSRFRPRPQQARGPDFPGNRSSGNGNGLGAPRGGGSRPGGRPPQGSMPSRLARRHGPGRKRSK